MNGKSKKKGERGIEVYFHWHVYAFLLVIKFLTFVSFLVVEEFSSGSHKFTEFFTTFLAVHPCVRPFI